MKLIESETLKNLAKAFAAECQARGRYEFIEYGARQQGYKAVAEIVDKIVYNEFNHARMFYTKMQDAEVPMLSNVDIKCGFPFKEKWDLEQNLHLASEDESAEIKLYPRFAKKAREEGFDEIATLFINIANIEKEHKKIFDKLYSQFKDKSLYDKQKEVVWKCPSCGYTYRGKEAVDKCPVCNEKQGSFNVIL